jgi:hypothetical protein
LAWALGVAAVAPFFIAVWLATYALDPEADTAPTQLAGMALPFYASGVVVTTVAGTLLARSKLFRWVEARPPLAPAIVAAAVILVLPAFLDAASGTDEISWVLRLLAATELSIALTWLAALRVGLSIAASVALGLALFVAAGSAD